MRSQIPEAVDKESRPNQSKGGCTDAKGFKTFRVGPAHSPWALDPQECTPADAPKNSSQHGCDEGSEKCLTYCEAWGSHPRYHKSQEDTDRRHLSQPSLESYKEIEEMRSKWEKYLKK